MLIGCVGCASRTPAPESLANVLEHTTRADELPLPSDALTVATYNVHGLLQRDAILRDLAALDRVNIWCLQEYRYLRGVEIETILPPGRWYVATIPLNRAPGPSEVWEAQVIASRFPIESIQVWPLDDVGIKRRVALVARVNVNGRCVLVVNTDHEPSFFAVRDGNTVQVRRLAEHLRECADESVIVAGDFNCAASLLRLSSNSGHVRRIDAAMAGAGFSPATPPGATFRSGPLRTHIDRIYVRQVVLDRGAIATTAKGSDHFPVWTRVTLPPRATNRSISDAAVAQ